MEVKQVVDVAKRYAADLFATEGLIDPRLEEIEFDESRGVWAVTIAMLRPLKSTSINNVAIQMAAIRGDDTPGARVYKVVKLRDDNERIISVKMREEIN